MCCQNPSQFFRLFSEKKIGETKEDYMAYFTILNFANKITITENELKTRCGHSPFFGVEFPATIKFL